MADQHLRVVVHDYSGHPGQMQLSRTLACHGHDVIYQHCPSYVTGKGAVERLPSDPETLTFEPFPMKSEFNRYSVVHRVTQEVQYGLQVGRRLTEEKPDVAVLSNVPLLAHALLCVRLRRHQIPMVFWHQDIYSSAISATARKKLGALGGVVAWLAEGIERFIARSSAAIVAISPTFFDKLNEWGVGDRTTVIPNWAPIAELPVQPRRNEWSERFGLSDVPVVMYSGTLGLKHDPSILSHIATRLAGQRPEARVVVITEGMGRTWLETWQKEHGATNLVLLDFQSYEDLPLMLGSADVLVAILEPDASKFSVPSKVLTYLCTQRAIMGVIPPDNSVAEILVSHHAGVVVDPSRRDEVADEVVRLLGDDALRARMGQAGRDYAEATFSPERAAEQFEAIFGHILASS
ncbi:MAG TPA: glycosyltransferase family 4 protein [Acidimicrobiales bacterium]|jgi:glycosyltransferase involved in cell wall biosynthesis|nr:glycosyltransferase family 4 protein [Acidimicrobiales bacterium]